MKKRILPALLALCMVLSLVPVTVFAVTQCSGDSDCVLADGHDGGHKYKCGCDGSACKKTEKHTAAGQCNEQVDTKGALCTDCSTAASNPGGGSDPVTPPEGDGDEEVVPCPDCGCPTGGEGQCVADGDCAHDEVGDTRPSTCKLVLCNSVDCQKQGTVHLKTAHVIGTDCSSEGNDAYNSSRKACTLDHHQNACAMKCPVAGCTLTKGHTENHMGTACTNDSRCPKAEGASGHENTCPKRGDVLDSANDTAGTGNVVVVLEKEQVYYFACACGEHHVDGKTQHGEGVANNCPNKISEGKTSANGKGVKETLTLTATWNEPYKFTPVTKDTENPELNTDDKVAAKNAELKEAAIEEAKARAAARPITAYNGGTETIYGNTVTLTDPDWDNAPLTAAVAAYKAANGTIRCADCKAQLGLTTCTKSVDCVAKTHLKGVCLSQCTHSAKCGNNKGDAAAHVVYYKVMDGETNKGSYATYEAAVAARTDKSWSIVTDPCPMAQVDESVVVGADEEAPAEDPTVKPDEPKAPEKAEDFSDLKGDEWYAEDLTNLMSKGIVKGSLDDGKYSFGATDKLTTSHLVVFLSRVLDKGLVTEGKDWDKAATAWATEDGLTEGVETGEIARKDVVLVLWRAAGKPESTQSLEALTDVEGLTEDETAALRWAVETKVITGYEDNTFKPADSITRAEMMAVLSRFDGVVNAK